MMPPPGTLTLDAPPAPVSELDAVERGPGPWDRSGLIIQRPELQPRAQRAIYGTVTAVAWVVWAYLWLPLVTLVAWYFGVRAFIREIVIPDQAVLLFTAVVYVLIIILLGGTLLLWSQYNLRRFGGEDRRAASPPVARHEVLGWFQIPETTLDTLQQSGSMVVEHGEHGDVTGVRPPAPGEWPVRPPVRGGPPARTS
jgi:biofilm PGA synthesis protein PgaD